MRGLKKIIFNSTLSLITFSTLSLSSCSTFEIRTLFKETYVPYPEEVKRIENLKYKLWIFDCKNKSIRYHTFLRKKGIISRVVSGKITGMSIGHAWVEVYNNKTEKWHMIDPTFRKNKDGLEVKEYFKRRHIFYIYPTNISEKDISKDGRYIKEIPGTKAL